MLKRRRPQPGDKWYMGEVFVRIRGKQQYLWRAFDQDGNVVDILVQSRRSATTAKRFFRKLLPPAPPSSPVCQPASCGTRCRLSHMARRRRSCARSNNLQSCHFDFQHPPLGNLTTTAEGSRTSMRSGAPTPLDELSSLYGQSPVLVIPVQAEGWRTIQRSENRSKEP
jgi:transposase-like protein